jgi:hypothetical protein
MAFIPTPGCAQVEIQQDWAGEACQTVLHYTNAGGVYGLTELLNLGDAIVAFLTQSFIRALWPTTWSLTGVRVIDVSDQFGSAVDVVTGLPSAGTRAGAQLPNNCCLVLTKRTLLRGRAFRGRIYFGPLTETDVVANIVNGAVVASTLANLSGLLAIEDAALVTHTMQVLSRQLNNVPRIEGEMTPVIGLTSDGVIDSQRRRLPGRGS